MRTFNELKNAVFVLFDNTAKFAVQSGYEGVSKNILKVKNDFQKKELMVVVCGEMRRGKSSLLTAFLEEEKIFPIDINTCTNVITIVRYGKTEKIEVILEKCGQGGEVKYESLPIKREEIEQYVTEYGNEQNRKRVNCLNVVLPNEKLKEGFVFVDTPGVGSLNFEHAQVTYGFLPHADVMLFVSDVLNPLTDSELKFMEKGFVFCKNVIFPLTKSDKKTGEEIRSTIESNRAKIKNVTKLDDNDIHIIPVSNRMKLRYLEKAKEEDLVNSNYPQLEELIWKTIYGKRSRILVLPFLQQLSDEVQKLRSNINIQLEALAQDKETVTRLTQELQEKSSKKQLLLAGNAKWKGDLQYELTNVSIQVSEDIHDESINISERMNVLLAQSGAAERIDPITAQINELLSGLVLNSRESISSKTFEITEDISSELGLSMDVNEEAINSVGFFRKRTIDYVKTQKSLADKVIDKGRQIGMKSMGGTAIGAVVGGILGGLAGIFGGPAGIIALASAGAQWGAGIGALGGTAKGAVDAVKNTKDDDLPAIRIALNNYISKNVNSIRSGVNLCIRELSKDLTQELTNQIADQIQQLDTTATQIKQNLALKQADIPKQTSKLNMQMSMVEGLEKSAAQLEVEIAKLE
ncbi:MAG: dynamin family protein [Mangrovibacterium sp.]